ncbi:protein kinase domain-containing protein [Pseudoalteromonas rubra]|uniref:Protein kinase domain-containing protein n=1 Tax=Pseudoalteromonas rubra TaxID=43658 RepID=A0A0U2X294_9GAMM|nr:hypothetical protein [Pseudoalteromonas rubra]ALU42388.1 hypothetical protein AT705_05150 [Pseudoalteromonas rubra]
MDHFKGLDSNRIYHKKKLLGKGGQGSVFLVEDDLEGAQYAVKWYNKAAGSIAQKEQIQALVARGAPPILDDGIHFIWPMECVTQEGNNSFGYVMPLIDTSVFTSMNRIIDQRDKQFLQPLQATLSRICRRLITALDAIHISGFAYCDINAGNIMMDPVNGAIVICDNDNVVINNCRPSIAGVWEFMAPEVGLGNSRPNADSDLYSVAMLIYFLWMWEHPMYGIKADGYRCLDGVVRSKIYCEEPIFVFHPTDKSNTAIGLEPDTHVRRWYRMCPPRLKTLFIKIFTDGVHNPSSRPRLPEWKKLFQDMEANEVTCQCGAKNVWDGVNKPLMCWRCEKEIKLPLCLSIPLGRYEKRVMLLSTGKEVFGSQLNSLDQEVATEKPLAVVELHPKSNKHLILRNISEQNWAFIGPDNSEHSFDSGVARVLVPGAKIRIGTQEIGIVGV